MISGLLFTLPVHWKMPDKINISVAYFNKKLNNKSVSFVKMQRKIEFFACFVVSDLTKVFTGKLIHLSLRRYHE